MEPRIDRAGIILDRSEAEVAMLLDGLAQYIQDTTSLTGTRRLSPVGIELEEDQYEVVIDDMQASRLRDAALFIARLYADGYEVWAAAYEKVRLEADLTDPVTVERLSLLDDVITLEGDRAGTVHMFAQSVLDMQQQSRNVALQVGSTN